MIITIIIAGAAVIALGAWLKWTVVPVRIAYNAGRQAERLIADPARFVPAFKAGYGIGRRDRRAGR